jgi:hypothetical protein
MSNIEAHHSYTSKWNYQILNQTYSYQIYLLPAATQGDEIQVQIVYSIRITMYNVL